MKDLVDQFRENEKNFKSGKNCAQNLDFDKRSRKRKRSDQRINKLMRDYETTGKD